MIYNENEIIESNENIQSISPKPSLVYDKKILMTENVNNKKLEKKLSDENLLKHKTTIEQTEFKAKTVHDGSKVDSLVRRSRALVDRVSYRQNSYSKVAAQDEKAFPEEENIKTSQSSIISNSDIGNVHDSSENNNNNNDEDDSDDDEDDDHHLEGVQDCAVAGMTTMSAMYIFALKRIHSLKSSYNESTKKESLQAKDVLGDAANISFIWAPSTDIEWWMAVLGGSLMFFHYFFLLKAFDNAPSTVINPLVQVSSTWMLVATAVISLITGGVFMMPFDLLCYVIIWIGGLLPSLNGNLQKMLTKAFWKQNFVICTVLSEILVGIYDILMSNVLQKSAKKEKFRKIKAADLEFEFFFIAWCGFVLTFCCFFGLIPTFRQKFIEIKNIPRKILLLSSIGQIFTLAGYFFSQYGYSLYYQASIVHAAESSLSQAMNLIFAVIAYKFLGLGRDSAVSNLKVKILSCIVVSIGLFMLAINAGDGMPQLSTETVKAEKILEDLNVDTDDEMKFGILGKT